MGKATKRENNYKSRISLDKKGDVFRDNLREVKPHWRHAPILAKQFAEGLATLGT